MIGQNTGYYWGQSRNSIGKSVYVSLSGLPADTYRVEVSSNLYNCKRIASFVITDPADFQLGTAPVITNPSCYQGHDGNIANLSITGGTGALSYRIKGENSTVVAPTCSHINWNTATTVTGLEEGEYTIEVKDSRGCTASFDSYTFNTKFGQYLELRDPYELIFATADFYMEDVVCATENTGLIELQGYDGTGVLTYTVSGAKGYHASNTTGKFPNLYADTYQVRVTDANGCQKSHPLVLKELNPKPVLSYVQTPTLCHSSTDGKIQLTVTNAVVGGNYDFALTDYQGVTQYASNGLFEFLSAGHYEAVVTEWNAGCVSHTLFATVTAPTPVAFTATKTDISCHGGNDGMVTLTASGGTPPYTFNANGHLKTAPSTVNYTGLGLGNYYVEVKDAHGCEVLTHPDLTIGQPDLLVFNSAITSTLCYGSSDGTITVNASGGTTVYEYSKDGGNTYQSNNVFTGLSEGIYFVTVRDAQGCTTGHTAYVPQPNPLEAFTTVTDVICQGAPIGKITFTKTQGGTAPYSYSIDGDKNYTQGKTLFTDLLAGTYDVWVKDANGCKIQMSVVVSEPANKIRVETTDHQHISCLGGNDGVLFVSATDGVNGYTYSLDGINFQASQKFENLTAQTYTITAQDAWGCMATNTFTLTQPNEILFSTAVTNLTCFEAQDGQIQIQTPTGGSGDYVYSIDNGTSFQSVAKFTGLTAGIYPTITQDKLGCRSTARDVIVTQPDPLTVNVNVSDVKCYLGSDGQIMFQGVGGTSPYQYSFDKGAFQTNPTYTGLVEGTYFMTVRDKNLCEYSTTVQVNQPAPFTATAKVTVDVLCKGEATGVIQVSPVGGVGGYMYSVDGGTNFITASSTITGLVTGNYNVVVKDANGCTAQGGFHTIVEPAQKLGFTSITKTMTSCFGKPDAVVDIQAVGGVPPYQYALDNNSYKSTSVFVGVNGGNHTFYVKDAHACIFSTTFNVLEPTPLAFTSVKTPLTCFESEDGTLTINASGGTTPYVYSIDHGVSFQSASNFTGLEAGNYTILFKDKNGCMASSTTATIIQPALLQLNHTINHVSCFGDNDGSVTLNGVGGNGSYQYNFDGQGFKTQQNYTTLLAGDYFVTVKDAKGCLHTETITITQPPQIQAKASVQRHVYCKHEATGVIQVAVQGGTAPYTYSLNGAAFTTVLDGLVDGIYHVDVKDAQGCTINAGFV